MCFIRRFTIGCMMKQLVTVLFLFCFIACFAQKEPEVSLKNVRGEFAVTSNMNITFDEAKEKARENAKAKAIQQVCGQRVNIWDKVEQSSTGETYNSLSIVQTDGIITDFSIKSEDFKKSEVLSTETIFYCVADVKVKKVALDPNFFANIDGVRSVYVENENLNFTIQPFQDCYVMIFLFENLDKGYLLYPNKKEPSKLLTANQKVFFPLKNGHDWSVTKESNAEKETNKLVFVFTKQEYKFDSDESDRSEIEKWMMKIPADQKFIYVSTFEIRKK